MSWDLKTVLWLWLKNSDAAKKIINNKNWCSSNIRHIVKIHLKLCQNWRKTNLFKGFAEKFGAHILKNIRSCSLCMLKRQIGYLQFSAVMTASKICLYTWRFLKNNFLVVYFRTVVLCKVFSALDFKSNSIQYVRIWKNLFLSL